MKDIINLGDLTKPADTLIKKISNLEHWRSPQSDFVGLGPGAFGFAGGHSTVNRLGLIGYCNLLEQGRLPLASIVPVSQMELRHRYFVLGVKAQFSGRLLSSQPIETRA